MGILLKEKNASYEAGNTVLSVTTIMLLFRIDYFQVYSFHWAVVTFRKACRILNENTNKPWKFDLFILSNVCDRSHLVLN